MIRFCKLFLALCVGLSSCFGQNKNYFSKENTLKYANYLFNNFEYELAMYEYSRLLDDYDFVLKKFLISSNKSENYKLGISTFKSMYQVDVQQEMLEINASQMRKKNITNVKYILGKTKSTNLPKSTFDLFLLVDVYHELEYPYEIMKDIKSSLKDDGVVVLLEYRKEDPSVPIKPLHKMSVKQVVKEMKYM